MLSFSPLNLNRTYVELKLAFLASISPISVHLNRTYVELKFGNTKKDNMQDLSESYLCRIEIIAMCGYQNIMFSSESYLCRIEIRKGRSQGVRKP